MNERAFRHWLGDARYALAAALHLLACMLFVETAGPERFVIAQSFAAAVIAFIVTATLCWQWKVFGNPHRAPAFAAHLAIFASVFFLTSRLYTRSPRSLSLLDLLAGGFQWAAKFLADTPAQVFEALRSPGIALLFLAICLALALRRALGVAWLVAVSFLAVALAMGSPAFTNHTAFLLGLASFAGGLWLQYENPEQRRFWTHIRDRLAGDPQVRGDLELKLRLLARMRALERPLREEECLGVIARALGRGTDEPLVREATVRVVRQLVEQDALASVHTSPTGRVLASDACLADAAEADAFSLVAGIPKAIVIGLVVVVWILSPIDLIPDATPIFGSVDDVAVFFLGTRAILHSFRKRRPALAAAHIQPTS